MAEYIEREKLLALADNRMRKIILALPAADVRPVVRGLWELSDETPYIRKHYCACLACPNRDSHEYTIISNRTLTDKEIVEMKAKLDPDYGRGRFA